jgi:hypothetical protein
MMASHTNQQTGKDRSFPVDSQYLAPVLIQHMDAVLVCLL